MDMMDIKLRVSDRLEASIYLGGDIKVLAAAWQDSQQDLNLLYENKDLFEQLNNKKEFYKKMIIENKMPAYVKARMKCISELVYVRAWKIRRDELKNSIGNGVLREFDNFIYNYKKQQEVLNNMPVRYEIDFAPAGYQLIEIVNGCENVLGTFPTLSLAESEMQGYILAGNCFPSTEQSNI